MADAVVADAAAAYTPGSFTFDSPPQVKQTQNGPLSAADSGTRDQGHPEHVDHKYMSQQEIDQNQDAVQQGNHQQQGGQQEGQGDFVTAAIKQDLLTSVEDFFQQEVAPRTAAIAQDMAALQYEAEVLTNQCTAEKDAVLEELNRIQQVVATFQTQIFQVLQ
eukprot:gene3164-3442_t